MKRPLNFGKPMLFNAKSRSGYTLVEMLVATAITMMLMTAVVTIFGTIGRTVSDSRTVVEGCDRLRAAALRLQMDFDGIIVNPDEGYVEFSEGPVGMIQAMAASSIAVNNLTGQPDYAVTDFDDVLMFTTRCGDASFKGRHGAATIESDVAEVAWFVRGNRLYRRVLLVAPGTQVGGSPYAHSDVSVRWDRSGNVVANSLADLALRENRYAHGPSWPYSSYWGLWGLPTLGDCSGNGFTGNTNPTVATPGGQIDFWERKPEEPISGASGNRVNEDVILTNVIGFDVKVWDILAQAYVDMGSQYAVAYADANLDPRSGLVGSANRVYDSWSNRQRTSKNPAVNISADGFDNNGIGGVDDESERETAPPYPYPLRGVKVEIRVFEPSSRQIHSVNVIGELLPK